MKQGDTGDGTGGLEPGVTYRWSPKRATIVHKANRPQLYFWPRFDGSTTAYVSLRVYDLKTPDCWPCDHQTPELLDITEPYELSIELYSWWARCEWDGFEEEFEFGPRHDGGSPADRQFVQATWSKSNHLGRPAVVVFYRGPGSDAGGAAEYSTTCDWAHGSWNCGGTEVEMADPGYLPDIDCSYMQEVLEED